MNKTMIKQCNFYIMYKIKLKNYFSFMIYEFEYNYCGRAIEVDGRSLRELP